MAPRKQGSRFLAVLLTGVLVVWTLLNLSFFALRPAFAGHYALGTNRVRHASVIVQAPRTVVNIDSGGFLPLETFEPAVSAYFATNPPLYPEMKEFFKENTFTAHWAHAIGGAVFFAYAFYAIFLGYQIRLGNGGQVFPLSYDQTARERHPYAMGLVLLFLVFEIPDGLTILAASEQPLLKSTHASTAVVALALMSIIGLIGYFMGGSKNARDAHTYAGSATVLALGVHGYFGLYLGWSY